MPESVTLREYLEALIRANDQRYAQRFDAQEKAVGAALSAAKEAVGKAEAAAEKRFEGVNEFRDTLRDQATNFITKGEVVQMALARDARLDNIEKIVDRMTAERAGLKGGWVLAVGVAGFVAMLIGVVLTVSNLLKG